jgi:K+-sensing histidine kinase KdpD
VIFGLRTVAPVPSLGVLYTLAVLPIAIRWGLAYAIPVAFASILAFNFFFLPPVYTLELQDGGAWVALCVNVAVAIVVSVLARSLEHSRGEVAESRARIVAASEIARRKIERDLHDTTQRNRAWCRSLSGSGSPRRACRTSSPRCKPGCGRSVNGSNRR